MYGDSRFLAITLHSKIHRCSSPLAPGEEFLTDKPRVKWIKASEVEIKKETLPLDTEIIVLEPALWKPELFADTVNHDYIEFLMKGEWWRS
jgi:hypothetical protein